MSKNVFNSDMNVECWKIEKYEELLEELKPNGILCDFIGFYLFRGQADDWKLAPKLYRDKLENYYTYCLRNCKFSDNDRWYYSDLEFNILQYFYNSAMNIGLHLPNVPLFNETYLKDDVMVGVNLEKDLFKYEGVPELGSLAQHYGLDTRLIDWSQSIFVALYFAASKAIEMIYKDNVIGNNPPIYINKNMVIWILPANGLLCGANNVITPPIKLITPLYCDNPNINAQRGILTYWVESDEDKKSEILNRDGLDKKVYDFYQNRPINKNEYGIKLQKIYIPMSECVKIIKHINMHGYNGNTLFPWYYNISENLKEKFFLERVVERFPELDNGQVEEKREMILI